MQKLRILFAGSGPFALDILKFLKQENFNIVGILTQPDKHQGRGRKLQENKIKVFANIHNIPILQPKTLRDEEIYITLSNFNADLMLVAAYGLLIPPNILTMFPLECVNVHASLLPSWRGASPIHQAILNGDKKTGITLMQMDVGLDTGDIIVAKDCNILPQDNLNTLSEKLLTIANDLLLHNLPKLPLPRQEQPQSNVTYADKIKKNDGKINWQEHSAIIIDRMFRAYVNWPHIFCILSDMITVMKIISMNIVDKNSCKHNFGEIIAVNKNGIFVQCKQGIIQILKLQFPGSKIISAQDSLNGKFKEFLQTGNFLH